MLLPPPTPPPVSRSGGYGRACDRVRTTNQCSDRQHSPVECLSSEYNSAPSKKLAVDFTAKPQLRAPGGVKDGG